MKGLLKIIYQQEKNNLQLWLPIIFAISIAVALKWQMRIEYLILINILISALLYYFKKHKNKILFYLLLFITMGYDRAYFTAIQQQKLPVVKEYLGECIVEGTVISKKDILKYNSRYKQEIIMSVDNIQCDKQQPETKPTKIVLKLKEYYDNIYYSRTKIKAKIFPLPAQKFNSSFNSKRYYLNYGITAIGYSAEILENSTDEKINIKQKINNFRFRFAKRIIETANDKKSASIIATLLTGQKNLADKTAVNEMNYSGLSHLLAISGIHMMTLISFVFFMVKWLLLRSKTIAIKFNVIKIASFISLFFTFFYLLLSGFSISAIRAYTMSSILLLSYITDRFNDSSRTVMVVMFLILLFSPESVFSIGFQLSFISVIAIISMVNSIREHNRQKEKTIFSNGKIGKFLNYVKTSFYISLMVELATTPITIYYFNNYTFYNVFSNLIAEPIVSMIILPFSILAIVLYFFKLEYIFTIPASWFMSLILKISSWIIKIPNSILLLKSPNFLVMLLTITAILIFSLCKSKIKYISFVLYFAGTVVFCFQKTPKIVIDYNDKSIYLIQDKNVNVYNPKYSTTEVIKKLATSNYKDITDRYENIDYINFYLTNGNEITINKYTLNFYSTRIVEIKRENSLALIY